MSGWAAAIGAAMDIGNTALGLYQSSKAYRRAKAMYQHRYQWAVDDMRKAGLNPVLAANGGGVSTAGLSNPSVQSASRLGENFSKSSANELVDAQKELYEMQKEAALSASVKDFNQARYLESMKDQADAVTVGVKQGNESRQFYNNWLKENPSAKNFGYMVNALTGGGTLPQAVNSAISMIK